MGSSGVARLVVSLALFFGASRSARAGETPLVVTRALYESPGPTLAPVLVVRAPLGAPIVLSLSQLGWTSGAMLEVRRSPRWKWRAAVAFTPGRAHLSHDVYDSDGHRSTASEFDATALRSAVGGAFKSRALSLFAHVVVGKEWLSGLPLEQRRDFASPFAGLELSLGLESLRSDDPLAARADGVRAGARVAALVGSRTWIDTDLALSAGRRWGGVFLHADASAFFVSLDSPATNVVLGGSWDVLGGAALVGHPLGAFRLTRGAAGTAGVDVRVLGPLELGLRGSALLGAPVVHHGVALVARTDLSGLDIVAGVGSPDGAFVRGDLLRTSVFGSVSGGLLFLP